jgi:secondary thiamine-phosphate synthase enzyme
MPVETRTLKVSSKRGMDIINITDSVSRELSKSGIRDGIVALFVSGSTASLSTIEFEPNLLSDFTDAMERLIPSGIRYRHKETWGDDNGKSHVRATLMGPGLTIPFNNKKLLLGTWQQVVLLDFDVPAREREIVMQIIGD